MHRFLQLVDERLRFVASELAGGLALVEPKRSAGITEPVVAGAFEEFEELAHLLARCRGTRRLTECHH